MHEEHTDPWTSKDGNTVMPFPSATAQRYVGERTHSYQSGDEDIWGSSKIRTQENKKTAAQAWKDWGDFVHDPLDATPKGRRSYETRPLRRGSSNPSKRYAETHPFPTYSQFGKPQLSDEFGRQFRWGDGSDVTQLEELGRLSNSKRGKEKQNALMYIRFPRGSRGRLSFPTPQSKIKMVDLKTGLLYVGDVGWINGDSNPSGATGSVFVYGMESVGFAPPEYIERSVRNLPRAYRRRVPTKPKASDV